MSADGIRPDHPNAAQLAAKAARPRVRRDVVSFVRRGNRLTRRLEEVWDRRAHDFVLDLPQGDRDTVPAPGVTLDLGELYGRRAPLIVEIGSGLGENVVAATLAHPERDHLACEVYHPGIGVALERLEKAVARRETGAMDDADERDDVDEPPTAAADRAALDLPRNLRFLPMDARAALGQLLPPASISEVWIFFPDPWHKSKHHKRRLVGPALLDVLAPLMVEGGMLRLATDWAHYAGHMREVLDADPRWTNLHPDGPRPTGDTTDAIPPTMPHEGWSPRFDGRVLTSFESKAHRAGRLIWDLTYQLTDPGAAPHPTDGGLA